MSLALEEITKEAMELPLHQRLALANRLIDSAESPDTQDVEVSAAWGLEIEDRIRAIDEGREVGICWEDVQKDVAKLLDR